MDFHFRIFFSYKTLFFSILLFPNKTLFFLLCFLIFKDSKGIIFFHHFWFCLGLITSLLVREAHLKCCLDFWISSQVYFFCFNCDETIFFPFPVKHFLFYRWMFLNSTLYSQLQWLTYLPTLSNLSLSQYIVLKTTIGHSAHRCQRQRQCLGQRALAHSWM